MSESYIINSINYSGKYTYQKVYTITYNANVLQVMVRQSSFVLIEEQFIHPGSRMDGEVNLAL